MASLVGPLYVFHLAVLPVLFSDTAFQRERTPAVVFFFWLPVSDSFVFVVAPFFS